MYEEMSGAASDDGTFSEKMEKKMKSFIIVKSSGMIRKKRTYT